MGIIAFGLSLQKLDDGLCHLGAEVLPNLQSSTAIGLCRAQRHGKSFLSTHALLGCPQTCEALKSEEVADVTDDVN